MPKKLLMGNILKPPKPPIDERVFAEYTFDNTVDSNCLPTITITGGYEVIDEVDGNITRRQLRNTKKNKPTVISFNGKVSLVTVEHLEANVSNASGMFFNCKILTSLNLTKLNVSKVSNFGGMFRGCSLLKQLDLSTFNTENATNTANMFQEATSLVSLNICNFNTSKVTNMNNMFNGCVSLTTLDLCNFNTTKVGNMSGMFNGCSSLRVLDLSSFDIAGVSNIGLMFQNCSVLSGELIVRNPSIGTYGNMFKNASTNPNAKFTVRYVDEATKAMAEKLVATKSSNSNVVLADSPGLQI